MATEPATTTEVVTPAEGTSTPGDTPAPPAEGEPKSLLDAIKKVVADPVASPAAKPETNPDGTVKTAATVTTADDLTKPPPFHEHPRWKAVIGERDGLKRNVAEMTPDAESFRQVRGFMEHHQLTPDEVKQGFAIMAALKGDPAKAWELLQPTIRDLGAFLGHELPPDLKAKVDEGLIDEPTARETARLRNTARFAEARNTVATQRTQQRDQQQAGAQVATQVDAFVATKAGSDPDYKRIEPLLAGMVRQKQAEWIAAGKSFTTVAKAVELTGEAYDAVKRHLGATVPARQAIKAVPVGNSTSTAARAAPKSMNDVVRQALAGTYTG